MWAGFVCLAVVSSDWLGNEPSGYMKMSEEMSSPVKPMQHFHGGFDSIELNIRNVPNILIQAQIKYIVTVRQT
jgi:hypothetical protein